ncbi:lmo0937 family membrane protein [Arachidicoccus ginsenosidimutans]|uniref:lmo0937 family membrane protein n=1 Tax=Arachidicoccus sp. BS20 TaxID=1850526 RepID=UPI0012E980BF|nr:lmo0937 family membrane protein [Arachidicoccus sp. BS20]
MKGILYIIAVLLVIGWIFGFVVYHVSGFLIHVLLIVAVIVLLINLLGGKKSD